METPIKSNGYYKYLIQVDWWQPQPGLKFAVLAQDILSKTKKDAVFLMNFLYPRALEVEFPCLSPVVGEIKEEKEETDILGNPVETIELMYPN